jgi:hypothetical protein
VWFAAKQALKARKQKYAVLYAIEQALLRKPIVLA